MAPQFPALPTTEFSMQEDDDNCGSRTVAHIVQVRNPCGLRSAPLNSSNFFFSYDNHKNRNDDNAGWCAGAKHSPSKLLAVFSGIVFCRTSGPLNEVEPTTKLWIEITS